jgi:hypothetical protein
MAAALAGVAACAPAERAEGPRGRLADGAGGVARVITVAHVMRPGAIVASVAYADTSRGAVTVTDGVAVAALGPGGRPTRPDADRDGRLYDRLTSASSVAGAAKAGLALVVARDERVPLRQGRWTRALRLADGRAAEVEMEARGGAPVSSVTVRGGGAVAFAVASEWRREGGAWALARRTLTAFEGGRATGWVETRVEAPVLRAASGADAPGAAARVLAVAGRGAKAVGDALGGALASPFAPAPLQAQAMTGPCGTQANAALDAIDDFVASGLIFAAATASGNPFAISAAYINWARSARKMDLMQDRLDECVASA